MSLSPGLSIVRVFLLPAALILTSCVVTTDENLWKNLDGSGDLSGDQALDGPQADSPGQEQGTDGPVLDLADGPLAETAPTDQLPEATGDGTGLPLGATCSSGSECASAHCKDSVCCNTACGSPCESCDQSSTLGTCTPSPEGTDPDKDCKKDPVASCGLDGSCDGKGGCRKYAQGTQCVAASCSGTSNFQPARQCNGTGTCVSKATISCAPYACDGANSQCFSSCTTDAQCIKYRCDTANSVCYDKCSSNTQCQTAYKCAGFTCK